MTCDVIEKRDGTKVIICSRSLRGKRCKFCKKPATFECDGPKPRRKSKHCDAPMCGDCRTKIGDQELGDDVDTIDYCPNCVK